MSILALLAAVAASPTAAAPPEKALAPSEIVAAAPAADWVEIAPSDLLVMDLAPDAQGRPRRVVIQLLPAPFSQGWVGNIRKLAAAHWWDGTSINRAQDNYVVQWGDPDGEDKTKAKALPDGLTAVPQSEYASIPTSATLPSYWFGGHRRKFNTVYGGDPPLPLPAAPNVHDAYSEGYAFAQSMAIAIKTVDQPRDNNFGRAGIIKVSEAWPIHCYGTVGVARDMPPDTGTGAELYAVIGHAPRQLDRNLAVVGRVIEGMEYLSTMPRGTGDLGFYKTASERTPIRSVRIGSEVPDLPSYEYLGTESKSFIRYAGARANRRDPFYVQPAGGADICNIPVPVRRRK